MNALFAIAIALAMGAYVPVCRAEPSLMQEDVTVFDAEVAAAAMTPPPKPFPRAILDAEITDDLVPQVAALLQAVAARGDKALILEINSPGGSVDAGFKITKLIEASEVPVYCLVDGEADSMAFYILQGCHGRLMTDRSILMAHEPALWISGFGGQQDDWKRGANNAVALLQALSKAMNRHMARHLYISFEQFSAKVSHGKSWWMDSDEALRVGAVTHVLASPAAADALVRSLLRE